MVRGDDGGSAGHAGVGQGGLTRKLTFTLQPVTVTSHSSTSSRKSRASFEPNDQVDIDQPQSTLWTRQEQVSGQRPSRLAPT